MTDIEYEYGLYASVDSQVTRYRLDVSGNFNAGEMWAFGSSPRVQQFYLFGDVTYGEGRFKKTGKSSISFLVQDDGGQWSDCRGDWQLN